MKPLLAATMKSRDEIMFPVMASPKIDGIRCLIHPELGPVTRSLKPVPNEYIREQLNRPEYYGFDGELIVGDVTGGNIWNTTTSGVMTRSGEPDFKLMVFDDFLHQGGFEERFRSLYVFPYDPRIRVLDHKHIFRWEQMDKFEADCLEKGYEGVMVRDTLGKYKFGRSTNKEGILTKIKRFEDAEGTIVGFEQFRVNDNDPFLNELGYQVRSSHKDNKVELEMIGKLQLSCPQFEQTFGVGSGFNMAQRQELWESRDSLIGKSVKFKYQPVGVKDKPRFPIFLGIRED